MTRSDWLWLAIHTASVALAVLAAALLTSGRASAHSWYPYQCCSDQDCRPIPFSAIKVTSEGYIVPSGELIPFRSTKIKPTPPEDPQQLFHWCTIGGKNTGHTLCLFVPQGGV